jgi:glycosyltransferase involved in cell wall biosynthesis
MDISVIIPLFNSGERVIILYQRLTNALRFCNNYEIIFIDDCSGDDTLKTIEGIKEEDRRIKIAQLKEHGGQYKALFTGYKLSQGEIVVSLDDDAFEEVKHIPEFIKKIYEGYDAVFAWRDKKGFPLFRKGASYMFNLIISLLIGMRIHDIGCSLKVRNRRVVEKMVSLGELTRAIKYYKYFRFTELRVPCKYTKQFSSRYSIIELTRKALLIVRSVLYEKYGHGSRGRLKCA